MEMDESDFSIDQRWD